MPDLPIDEGRMDNRAKKLALYGRRSKTYIFLKYVPPPEDCCEGAANATPESDGNDEDEEEAADAEQAKDDEEESKPVEVEQEESFMNKLVIDADNQAKSYFDVIILLFVGYSCI